MKKWKRIACEEDTKHAIKLAAAQKKTTINDLLKDTFGQPTQEVKQDKKTKNWPF